MPILLYLWLVSPWIVVALLSAALAYWFVNATAVGRAIGEVAELWFARAVGAFIVALMAVQVLLLAYAILEWLFPSLSVWFQRSLGG
jgi:hypothetical protein